jgi:hypothetical protein
LIGRDWTYFGRLRHERKKKLQDPLNVPIEATACGSR